MFRPEGKTAGLKPDLSLMCYGWLIFHNQHQVAQGYGSYTHRNVSSSNGAEYLALIEGLEALSDLRLQNENILIMGDAKSVIDQMQGTAEATSPRIQLLYLRAMQTSQNFSRLVWRWVPRQQNREADQLSRKALRNIRQQKLQSLSSFGNPGHSAGFHLLSDLMVCQRPILNSAY